MQGVCLAPGTINCTYWGQKLLHKNLKWAHNTNPIVLLSEHQTRNSLCFPMSISFLSSRLACSSTPSPKLMSVITLTSDPGSYHPTPWAPPCLFFPLNVINCEHVGSGTLQVDWDLLLLLICNNDCNISNWELRSMVIITAGTVIKWLFIVTFLCCGQFYQGFLI